MTAWDPTLTRHLMIRVAGKPDMLLLDEPTNHLSIGAVLWLARELRSSPTWEERIIVVVPPPSSLLPPASCRANC